MIPLLADADVYTIAEELFAAMVDGEPGTLCSLRQHGPRTLSRAASAARVQ